MTLSEEIKQNAVVLVITNNSRADETAGLVCAILENSMSRIGYVIMEKPLTEVETTLRNEGMNLEKYFFIDVKTSSLKTPPDSANCIYISSPSSLTELRVGCTTLLNEKNREVIFFDNISSLLNHVDRFDVAKFVNTIILGIHNHGKKLVMISVTEDSERLINDIKMLVDSVVEII